MSGLHESCMELLEKERAIKVELLDHFKEMVDAFHVTGRHGGDILRCESYVCAHNLKLVAKAERKP